MPDMISKDLGPVSGYAVAVAHGYTGTEAQWIEEVLKGTQNAQTATQKAAEATQSANTASQSATSASNSATTATQKASEAASSATAASGSATNAANSATTATQQATAASGSATAAAGSASAAAADKTAVQNLANTFTNTTVPNAVSQVNTAGATQVAAVQAKGEEVLDSIPEDYTTLSNDVSDLKSSFNQYETGIVVLESGTFADADGVTKTVSNRRIRNSAVIPIHGIKRITAPTGYNIWLFALNKAKTLISATSSWVNVLEISTLPTDTAYINFAIRNQSTPTADISGQIDTVQSGLSIEYVSYYSMSQLSDIAATVEEKVTPINLFNSTVHTHSGIQSQTIGDSYGKVTASDSYYYTDLIDLPEKLFVFTNFYGGTTVYVTFFNSADAVVGSASGNNLFLTSFPSTAVSFCVCAGNSTLNTLIVSDSLPTYYTKDGSIVAADNKATQEYRRIDRGVVSGYYPSRTSAGGAVYPLSTSASVMTSYPVSVEGIENVSYRNESAYYPAVLFFDNAGKVVSNASISPNTSGTIPVPQGAIGFIWYASVFDADTKICFVKGNNVPNKVYGFDDVEVIGLTTDETARNPLFGKNILFVGDSITAGLGYNGGWVTLINNNYDCFATNEGHSGWTICPLPNRTDNLMTLLSTLTGSYDIVALSGGYNDFTVASPASFGEVTPYTYSALDTTTFCGALEQYIRTAKSKWKTAKICYVLTMKREYNTVSYNTLQEQYWDAIREICEKYAIPLIDLYKTSGLVGVTVDGVTDEMTSYYYKDGDGTHPNAAGYEYLYPKIARFLMGL